jgi:hypothetical protein
MSNSNLNSDTDLRNLIANGYSTWEKTYKHTDSDEEATKLLITTLKDVIVASKGTKDPPSLGAFAHWLFSARLVQQGSPRVILDDQLAASLIATNVGLESAELIKPPWKAFIIELPPGLLTYDFEGELRSYQRVLIHYVDYGTSTQWSYWFRELNEVGGAPGVFAKATTEKMILDDWNEVDSRVDDQQSRVGYLVGRLILSLCLALSDPTTTTLREQKRSKGRGSRFRTPHSTPDPRNFFVGRPITVDCRPAIRDFLSNTGKKNGSINVQTLVRGHWKHQAHGVGRALRKLIHVEPYWKGPEDAKILIRPTRVQGSET